MKTYLALTALLCSLASAVDLLDDDLLDYDDLLDDDELSDDETSARTMSFWSSESKGYELTMERVTWHEAQSRCEAKGMQLASINSQEDQDFVVSL